MSNPTHLMYLKRSIEGWNRWRSRHPEIIPDFSDAYLCASSLCAANLSTACLRQADLYSADLWCADLENSIMTGVSKYDLRGANIGSFADTVEAGGQQRAVQYNQSALDTVPDWQVLTELEAIFDGLAKQATQVPMHQRPQVVAKVLQKKAKTNPDFKARLFKAVESGSEELLRVFTQNPYISIPIALVKGWVTAAS